jgi:hypothetical protein
MAQDDRNWQPLRDLARPFDANLESLATRDLVLATALANLAPETEYLVAPACDRVHLARRNPGSSDVEYLPNPVPPAAAAQVVARLYPSGKCTEPVLIAGLDQGWLWQSVFALPIDTPHAPGHTPPLYLLTVDLERLWAVLHLHDWRAMLSHPRTRIFAGTDAVERATRAMIDRPEVPFPRLCVTIDPKTWPAGTSIDSVTNTALHSAGARAKRLNDQVALAYGGLSIDELATRFASGRKLRVMGITSRFTTFLQYSMRDWLGAFEALGHQTRMVIEPDESAQLNRIAFAQASAEFRPELILMIDHYRGEFSGLPTNVPWVMWIQDQLPNILRPEAGAAQTEFDYTIGYGRAECVYRYGYPSERFLPVMVPTNEVRFQPRRLSSDEYARYGCDISFVSHCSSPAELVLAAELARQSAPEAKALLERAFAKLESRYGQGECVAMPFEFRRIIDESCNEIGVTLDDGSALMNVLTARFNNTMFRHQTLGWLADLAEQQHLRLHLYGRGWENHPRFARYARGIADNETQLSAIYRASHINLQVSPFGAAHQRVFDGLSAGAFFLFRACPGDRADRIYRDLWNWCVAHNVRTDHQLQTRADDHVRAWIDELTRINGREPFELGYDFVSELSVTAADGFSRNAATLWDQYDQVAFDSREQLHRLVRHFLHDDAGRAAITRDMRQRVLERMTYKSVASRTIELISRDLTRRALNERSTERTSLAA